MKNLHTNHGENNRSPLSVGATFILSSIIIILMILVTHSNMDSAATKNSREEAEEVCTTSSIVTTEISSTTSSTTSSTKTTTKMTSTTTTTSTTTATTTTTVQENTVLTEPITEPPAPEPQPEPVQEYVEPQPESQPESQSEPINNGLLITDYERTLLRNVVAHEYGSNWVSTYEKAKVVAVVMNRVYSPKYPNTIESVLIQPDQFTGYWACSYEWSSVTQSCRDAVDYYFAHPEEFGAWLGFWGDGTYNHFY